MRLTLMKPERWPVTTTVSLVIAALLFCQCAREQEDTRPPEGQAIDTPAMADTVKMGFDTTATMYDTMAVRSETMYPGARPPTSSQPPLPPPPPPTSAAAGPTESHAFYVDSILECMDSARIAFNLPDSQMNLGERRTIQLLVDMKMPAAESLAARIAEPGTINVHSIKVSETMEACLTGAGFEITAITPDTQAVSCRDITEWKWDIKAIEKGRQRLHLTLNAIVEVEGTQRTRSIRTFDQYIVVRVSAGKQVVAYIDKNKSWLWTAIVVPIGGAVWGWIRHRRKKPKPIGQ